MEFREWLLNERMEKRLMYHGTSDINLPSILSQGLIPNPKKRSWQDDPHASWTSPSRASLPGIYVTNNLMTAVSSSTRAVRELGGEFPVIIIMKIQPETMVSDEDDVSFDARKIPGFPGLVPVTDHEYSLLSLYDIYLKLQHNDYKGEYADYEKEKNRKQFEEQKEIYIKHILDSFRPSPDKDLHPKLKNRLKQIADAGFYITMLRAVSHLVKRSKPWDLPNSVRKYGAPDPSKTEQEFKKYEDQLTRTLKSVAREGKTFGRANGRILEPIQYKGTNKIVCVVREQKSKTKEYGSAIEVLYGDPPSEFLYEWKARIGEIEWYKK